MAFSVSYMAATPGAKRIRGRFEVETLEQIGDLKGLVCDHITEQDKAGFRAR